MKIKASKNLVRILKRAYYAPSHPGSLGGQERLFRAVKSLGVSRAQVKRFLSHQDPYTLHRPARRRFSRRKTIVHGIDDQWQADLVDMSDLARANSGTRYLLTVVDCFSRHAWAVPAKRKDGTTMRQAFIDLLDRHAQGRKPRLIQTDKGKEFYNPQVKSEFARRGIELFSTDSDVKASMVERFNRTLKQRMWTWFTANRTRRYLDILPSLLNGYNRSLHRSLGTSPTEASRKAKEANLWAMMYGPHFASSSSRSQKIAPLSLGSEVRISKAKAAFQKGYLPNWTEEIFRIRQARRGRSPRGYKLEDTSGDPVTGEFYSEELQPIAPKLKDRNTIYRIERVLSKRAVGSRKEQWHIKWLGWPSKYNSWIRKTDAVTIR